MIMKFILLIFGLILIVKASDMFVDSASSLATNLKMPKILIALTIASFGTCTPELAISFKSVFSGSGDVAVANVLGSNIINILLIIGISSFIYPIKVKSETVKKQLPILVVITSFFSISVIRNLLLNNRYILVWTDALMLLFIFILFMFYIISIAKIKKTTATVEKPKYGLKKSIVLTIICIIIIIFSSDLVVDNATYIAQFFGISEKIITMTVIVIGTSLPELTTTIMASKKKEFDIAIGNIIGTNIFNLGIVLGFPILLNNGLISNSFNIIDALVVESAAFILYLFAKDDRKLSRREGFLMLILFILYYIYMFLN